MDRETVVSRLFDSVSRKEQRSRPKRCANIKKQAKSSQFFERKAELAVTGEKKG